VLLRLRVLHCVFARSQNRLMTQGLNGSSPPRYTGMFDVLKQVTLQTVTDTLLSIA
jgi:hypothetical protein